MADRQVVIVHGWSDNSKSFEPLARFLKRNGYQAVPIWLGDYPSREDDVRVEDVARRMEAVIREYMASGKLSNSFDMIVHSTGGLVARQWVSAYYASGRCPMKRLIMLAPANFGSVLAHKGRSFIGRIVKGYDNWFETG
jgi:triacylglycerol esterase/lipase EstA (alpha/beta hydrolase family)